MMFAPTHLFALFIVAAAFLYAVVRYHIIKGVAWSMFPLFISNKAIALSALALIALSYALGPLARLFPSAFGQALVARKFFGLFGFGLAAVHSMMSLLILSPSYYPKFFEENGTLNLTGELSLLFGIVSLALFSIVAATSLPSIASALEHERWVRFQHLGYWGLVVIAGHVFTMGIHGWLNVQSWPGRLLPISLIAFIIVLVTLILRAVTLAMPHTPK